MINQVCNNFDSEDNAEWQYDLKYSNIAPYKGEMDIFTNINGHIAL